MMTNTQPGGKTDMTCPRCNALVNVGGGVCMRCGYAVQAGDELSSYWTSVEVMCEAMGLDRHDLADKERAEAALGWLGSHGWNLVRIR